jgi:cytochrome c nitrite reductase small subunit
MLKLLERAYDRIREIYGTKHFIALFVLLVIISGAGLLIGAKYSAYIRKDPEYCNSCHLMQKVFSDWHNSDHKTVTCQQCHKLSVIEQDILLVKHIIYGKTKIPQKHGKQLPWESCGDCHWEQRSQGKDLPEKRYGHFRHDFVECFNCHPFVGHNFPYDVKACERCHRGKNVHGSGMEGLSCVDCHIFSLREGTEKNRVIPTRQRCMKCHERTMKDQFPASAPMARLECFECHNPHGAIKPADASCLGCHTKDLKDKGHLVHKAACKSCHKAHLWKADATKKLCSSCHPYRKPEGLFVRP